MVANFEEEYPQYAQGQTHQQELHPLIGFSIPSHGEDALDDCECKYESELLTTLKG